MNMKCTLPNSTFKLSLIAASIAAGLVPIQAEESTALDEIIVIGQTAQIEKAIEEQRDSETIKSVVHSDDIGQLPDDNVAEALRRLPGVSVQNDQGEGRFVTVRGLAPELNSVHINGSLIPAPEDDTRAVALDVLPSELIQSLSVVKTLTPDMDSNALGGAIEVETLSAFDHDGLFTSVTIEGNFDTNTDELSPKISGAISDVFELGGDDQLGVAFAASFEQRDFGSDNVETGGDWDFEDGAALEETEMRDYNITRERLGFGLNLDYRPNENSEIYLRSLFSSFKDTETRHATAVEFGELVEEDGELEFDGAALATNATGLAEVEREIKDREETQQIQSYVLGGETTQGAWTFAGTAGYGYAEEETPLHIGGGKFKGGEFENVSFSSARKPIALGDEDFFNSEEYELDEVEQEEQITTDTLYNFGLDIARDFQINDGLFMQPKVGAKFTMREKDNNVEAFVFEDFGDAGFEDDQLTLNNFEAGSVDYSLGQFGPAINADEVENIINQMDAADFYDEEESTIADYTMNEDVTAVYLMNTIDLEDWSFIAGVRYENTSFTAEGTRINAGDAVEESFITVKKDNDYDNFLPSLHARYFIDNDMSVRAAFTSSVVRPTFEALAPGFLFESDETDDAGNPTEIEAEFGNPDLKPLESNNIDLGFESYFGKAGMASVYGFYKDINNFVYQTDLAGTAGFENFDEAITFANGSSADVLGVEFAYTQKLEALNGLILGTNLTLSSSEAEIEGLGEKRTISLPGQSDVVANAIIGWENEAVNLRLSGNYKSNYLQEVSAIDDSALDLYSDEQFFLDFSAGYFIMPNLQLSFEAKNLTDEVFYVYTGQESYNAQYEEYGPSYKLALTFTNF